LIATLGALTFTNHDFSPPAIRIANIGARCARAP